MESSIIKTQTKNPEVTEFKDNNQKIDVKTEVHSTRKDFSVQSTFSENQESIYETIAHKDVILNLNWERRYDVYAQVLKIIEDEIYCECIIDEENRIYQEMAFDKSLFRHIPNLKSNKLIVIRISEKAGLIQHEFFNGEGFLKAKEFFNTDDIGSEIDNYPKPELL